MSQQKWHATVSYANTTTPDQVTDELAESITALPGYGHARLDGQHAHLSMTVEASTLRKATDEAFKAAQTAYASAFDMPGTPVAIHVLTEEQHQRLMAHPGPMDLVNATEAADMLHVSRQRLHELADEDPDFPAPVATLTTGRVWIRRSIQEFDRQWQRKPGRPPKTTTR